MKLIDADQLIAEIERLKEETPIGICEYDKGEENGRYEVLNHLLSTITSLQQEQSEVDLEKEIKHFLSNATKMNKGEWRGKYPISDIGFRAVARHFYELGLNARNEGKNYE